MTGCSPLLASPTAWLGRRYSHAEGDPARWHNPERSNDLSDQIATLALLPTPCARDWKGQGYPGQLPTELRLLPTPAATEYGNNQSPSPGAAVRPSLDGLVRLLPTPNANVNRTGRDRLTFKQWAEPGLEQMCEIAMGVLPREFEAPDELKGKAREAWASSGASSSPPSAAGKPSTGLRLNPWFVEWMIGAPPGWSDPDCPLSATEFKSRSRISSAGTSSSGSEER